MRVLFTFGSSSKSPLHESPHQSLQCPYQSPPLPHSLTVWLGAWRARWSGCRSSQRQRRSGWKNCCLPVNAGASAWLIVKAPTVLATNESTVTVQCPHSWGTLRWRPKRSRGLWMLWINRDCRRTWRFMEDLCANDPSYGPVKILQQVRFCLQAVI